MNKNRVDVYFHIACRENIYASIILTLKESLWNDDDVTAPS